MGIRETLNRNPGITTGATVAIIVLAVGFVIWYSLPSHPGMGGSNKAYYSEDDGKTTFVDDFKLKAPFDHKGKEAVRAYVYTCDGGKNKFVGYLEKYTKDAKKKLEDAEKADANPKKDPMQPPMMMIIGEEVRWTGTLVKKPGQGTWVPMQDPRAQEIMSLKCPDGTVNGLEPWPAK